MDLIQFTYGFILVASLQLKESYSVPAVPGLFIFGDSLSDAGNNNPLVTLARADYPPYGLDHPLGTTGRFCNGRTTIDLVGEHLGLEGYIPPYPKANDPSTDITKGINYASGSAGIKLETGMQVGGRIPMDWQLGRHEEITNKIKSQMPNAEAHLNQCLYSIYVGSNDWMLNYFSGGGTVVLWNSGLFCSQLITQLTSQIDRLHGLGARKVVIFGLQPLGCLPPINPVGICSVFTNAILSDYNNKLRDLAQTMNSKYPDSRFTWINTMSILTPDLKGLGLPNLNVPCCGAQMQVCLPFSIPCPNRNDHAYWDGAHTTERANRPLAQRAYQKQQDDDAVPIDIATLASLKI